MSKLQVPDKEATVRFTVDMSWGGNKEAETVTQKG